jgi:hypothetical protein
MKHLKAKAGKLPKKLTLEPKFTKGKQSMSDETKYVFEEDPKPPKKEVETLKVDVKRPNEDAKSQKEEPQNPQDELRRQKAEQEKAAKEQEKAEKEAKEKAEKEAKEKAAFEKDIAGFKEAHKDEIEKFGDEVVSPFGVTVTTDKATATGHDTYEFHFRKRGRVSPVSGTPAALAPSADTLFWRPQSGRKFALQKVFARVIKATGTGPFGTAPTVGIKTGTVTGTAAVPIFTPGAAVATATGVTFASELTVIPVTSEILFDNTKPLFLSLVTAGAVGSVTAFDVEVIATAVKVSE